MKYINPQIESQLDKVLFQCRDNMQYLRSFIYCNGPVQYFLDTNSTEDKHWGPKLFTVARSTGNKYFGVSGEI